MPAVITPGEIQHFPVIIFSVSWSSGQGSVSNLINLKYRRRSESDRDITRWFYSCEKVAVDLVTNKFLSIHICQLNCQMISDLLWTSLSINVHILFSTLLSRTVDITSTV